MTRSIKLCLALLFLIFAPFAHAGKVETNVTLSSYWVSNDNTFIPTPWSTSKASPAPPGPTPSSKAPSAPTFRPHDRHRRLEERHQAPAHERPRYVLGTGQPRLRQRRPQKSWASKWDARTKKWIPLTGIWYLYVDRDIRPGSYPKIQLMPQTRPANWYRGYKRSYYQVPFPQMAADLAHAKIVANNGDFLPMGAYFKITKLGVNVHNVPGMNAFLTANKFEVLDMGVSGRGFDVHQGLQYFEAEDMDKYSLWMPGSTQHDTRGATHRSPGRLQPQRHLHGLGNSSGKPNGNTTPPK